KTRARCEGSSHEELLDKSSLRAVAGCRKGTIDAKCRSRRIQTTHFREHECERAVCIADHRDRSTRERFRRAVENRHARRAPSLAETNIDAHRNVHVHTSRTGFDADLCHGQTHRRRAPVAGRVPAKLSCDAGPYVEEMCALETGGAARPPN